MNQWSNEPILSPKGQKDDTTPGFFHAGGVAVFRGGLKKGSFATVAVTLCRTASTVSSIWRLVPGSAWPEATLAKAIIFLRRGDHVVEVALPTCTRPLYTGTATREAVLGTWGARPTAW